MAHQVSPAGVVGRNQLIERIWQRLKSKSVRFLAERRVGKTSVLKKMVAEPTAGFHPIFLDLEKVHSADRFVEVLLSELKSLMSIKDKAAKGFGDILAMFGGTEVAGMVKVPELGKRDWQKAIEKTFQAICANNPDTLFVLMFDELPYMLQSIAIQDARSGATDNFALAILDTLRAARQENANLRMIFCGSVGLHHVLASLRGDVHASQPVNDMQALEIHPLQRTDAVQLTKELMSMEQVLVSPEHMDVIANRIAQETDCVPFYIERVVSRLAEQDGPVIESSVDRIINRQLVDDKNDWEMQHFRDRLEIYYKGSVVDVHGSILQRHLVSRRILDHIACEDQPQSIDDVWAAVKSRMALDDRDAVIELLSLLAQDHYLITDDSKRYTFRFPLIRRWWLMAHGLAQGG
ncbi:MAG: hypothetical protein KDB01_02735, partial [Planctomycetaceae bacterium]|nr:hypothetical protein [Planctomycetaceae bacterium]